MYLYSDQLLNIVSCLSPGWELGSLREMIRPGALAIISPMAVGEFLGHIYGNWHSYLCPLHDASVIQLTWFAGVIFRILGHSTGQPLLGAKLVASMLMFATVAGILMALFLNTTGGA